MSSVSVIGCFELLGLAYYIGKVLLATTYAFCTRGFNRWFHIQHLFWDMLPMLSCYSAMKLLGRVVPAIVFEELKEQKVRLADAEGVDKMIAYLGVVTWVLGMASSFIVGFDTLLMKLRILSVTVHLPYFTLSVLPACIQFMVQVLGIVQLGPFVRKRLFLFIFGGEDAILQDEEIELMEVWSSLLCRHMYYEAPFHHFVILMLSWSDEDFQRLVINEDEKEKFKLSTMDDIEPDIGRADGDRRSSSDSIVKEGSEMSNKGSEKHTLAKLEAGVGGYVYQCCNCSEPFLSLT
jgi:hypothetical protein